MLLGVVAGLILAVPIILPPLLFVWYLDVSGLHAISKQARKRRVSPVTESLE